jgi:hypothetical protein
MSNLVEHARTELELIGEDEAYAASLVAAIAAFASFGHSGGSAMCAIEQLNALLQFENLAPLTANHDEWTDRSVESGYPLWQSTRNSKAFSENGGQTYWLVDDDAKTIHYPEAAAA